MNAKEYLKARDVETTQLENVSVGRLSIGAEFIISGKRGVIVSPKRGTVSDRYLSLLSGDGVAIVIAEGGASLFFYEKLQKGKELVLIRALKPFKPLLFPTFEVFEYLSALLRRAVKKREYISQITSHVIAARVSDEKNGAVHGWDNSVVDSVEGSASLLNRITGQVKSTDVDMEGILKVCAMIAGFRITPETQKESALLLDWFGRLNDSKKNIHGLPLELSPVFQTIGQGAKAVSIVTSAIGAQFSALFGQSDNVIILGNGCSDALLILQTIYPNAHFSTENYLERKADEFMDTVILIPPFGKSFSVKLGMTLAHSFFKDKAAERKYPAEYLYVFNAIEQCNPNGTVVAVVPEGLLSGSSHSAFRNWLLDSVQILGVVGLPAGFCFSGTAVRCSILFLKKADEIPADYSISMIELRPEDFVNNLTGSIIEAIQDILVPKDHS